MVIKESIIFLWIDKGMRVEDDVSVWMCCVLVFFIVGRNTRVEF